VAGARIASWMSPRQTHSFISSLIRFQTAAFRLGGDFRGQVIARREFAVRKNLY
jgi:hypothetical protein